VEATTIAVSASGSRGSITLNRPEKLNPLSPTTLVELAEAARWVDGPRAVKVVVVSGAGRAFSAGADIAAFATAEAGDGSLPAREGADLGRQMAEAIEGMRAVTVAKVHGHCVGGGVVLVAACDLRVAATSTRFSIPEVALGIPLTWGGIPRLVREIGPAMTRELVLTCRPFDAAEAKAIGFVNRVVADDELDAAVDGLVAVLDERSAFTLEATKRRVAAVTETMVGVSDAWADADSLVTARRDPESRAAAAAYLDALARRRR
jgi:enoyl-CoA hydratase/carnithine racemase